MMLHFMVQHFPYIHKFVLFCVRHQLEQHANKLRFFWDPDHYSLPFQLHTRVPFSSIVMYGAYCVFVTDALVI